MRLCKYINTVYNLDKFIGVEVVDNSNDKTDLISILFRFEGDYRLSADEDCTPYSFSIGISSSALVSGTGCKSNDIESVYENSMHDVLKLLADEFVEEFTDKLKQIQLEETGILDLGQIKRNIIKDVKDRCNKL